MIAGRGEIERKIRDLQILGSELDDIFDRCGRGTIADCRIIESMSPEP